MTGSLFCSFFQETWCGGGCSSTGPVARGTCCRAGNCSGTREREGEVGVSDSADSILLCLIREELKELRKQMTDIEKSLMQQVRE